MGLQGKRVSLRPLIRDDLDEVEAWAPYTDPLYVDWNRFPWHRLGKDLWHELQTTDRAVERYAIVDPAGRVIGVLGLILDEGQTPLLSIFLGAEYVNRGLGTDALETLLQHVFTERGFKAVCLDVAASNRRARHTYEKCGFRLVDARYRPMEEHESLAFLSEPHYRELRSYYRRRHGRTYALYFRMVIRAEDWQARHSSCNLPDQPA